MKKSIFSVFVLWVFSSFSFAGEALNVTNLEPWQGDFISRLYLIDRPELADVYEKVSKETEKLGNPRTVPQVKQSLKKLFHTDFYKLRILGDTISFYILSSGEKPVLAVQHQYRFEKIVTFQYRGRQSQWYAFRAVQPQNRETPYSFVLLMKANQKNGGEPHFHIRYGNQGYLPLVADSMKNWWPCMLKSDFDLDRFKAGYVAEQMATVIE